jgi:predicted ArsR family transcriptional regulator
VRTGGRPLTRAEVAAEVGISVRLAAFHLEKLLSEGFLEATYERDERSVGHPAKRYRPTGLELEVSIPPRRYDLAAEILAEVLEAESPDPPLESLGEVAAEYGRQVGRRARARNGDSRLLTALNVIGYEPATSGDDVVLRNCPFRHVAQARPEIICQMNLAFVAGVLAGTQSRSFHAVMSPSTERCCVVVTS